MLVLLMLLPLAAAYAVEEGDGFFREPLEEDDIKGVATPALDMSLEEYYQENGTLPEELADALEEGENTPFIPDDIEVEEPDDKRIFGNDDRVKVKNPKKYPYSAIAYMKVHARCGCSWTGSAFMVSKKCAMTAAHCLVCTDHSKTADRIDLYFGYRKGGYVKHVRNNCHYWYGTSFKNHNYSDYVDWDYGYIIFDSNIGKYTGWFGSKAATDSELRSGYYEVAGYRNGDMRRDRTKAEPINSNLFAHWADTKGGYSGCPVFDKEYYVVGINICENATSNKARRLTSDLFQQMRENGVRFS